VSNGARIEIIDICEEFSGLTALSDDRLVEVVWRALTTEHASLAVVAPLARRYPADVVPFAALREYREDALAQLRELMLPEEETYVGWSEIAGVNFPTCPGIEVVFDLNALLMVPSRSSAAVPAGAEAPAIVRLGAENAAEMVALTDVAFPGFFRPRTHVMGSYWGIRAEGELIAMAGERLAVPGMREISAVCTRPGHTGQGHAAHLIRHLLNEHASAGLESFLHVAETNQRAIALYGRLGFVVVGATRCTRIRRTAI
jgi:predicted GNAT family acetyltransferase